MDRKYSEWDRVYRENRPEELPWETGEPRENLVKWLEDGSISAGRALDICCGAGLQSIYLAKKGFSVSCLDISKNAISHARERAEKAGVDLDLHVENFLELPFEENSFSLVFDSGCFHHVKLEDRERYIGNVYRVLKKGGAYFLLCFSDALGDRWNHFSLKDIEDLFSDRFEIVKKDHFESVEGDDVKRAFRNFLMYRK